jgi:4-hydroxy-tetrahydrodipicolinate synthase
VSTFGHVMTAMVTPFDPDGKVAHGRAAELASRLLSEGSDSLLVAGTTGESPTLSHDEKLALFQTVKKAAGAHPVVAGTGTNDTAASVALTREAEECGVDGILVVNPYYNKPPQEGLYRHFRAVAEATRLPVIIYNIPGRTGVNLDVATLARLAELPNVVAVKEASGNLDQVSDTARTVGAGFGALAKRPVVSGRGGAGEGGPAERFAIYSGDDSLTLPMLSVGAFGVISVVSHVAGPQVQEMVSAFHRGDTGRAAALHARLFPLFKGLFMTTNPIPVKAALKLKGFDPGPLRLPLVEATPEQVGRIRQLMEEVGVLS